MNFLCKLILFSLVLAILQKAIIVMFLIIALTLLYGLIFQPAQTVRCIVVLMMMSYPSWAVALVISALCVNIWRDSSALMQAGNE